MSVPDFSNLSRTNIVPFLADVVERRGGDSYIGEAVTMAEHMLQAAQQAEDADAGDELIAAALLHDIGHYLSEFPPDAADEGIDNNHESAGAAVLAPYFPSVITDCVKYHVAAKRYLCATDADYFKSLSEASVLSLKLQGGPMNSDEVKCFKKLQNLDAIVSVRIWDDLAKDPSITTRPFSHYLPVLQRVVR